MEKMRLLWKVLEEIRRFQEVPYELWPPSPGLQKYMHVAVVLSEDELYEQVAVRELKRPK
jgi:hypothetical protein